MKAKSLDEVNADSLFELRRIYEEFTPGSIGFAKAVMSHCGYGMSLERIQEYGQRFKTPEEFQDYFLNGDLNKLLTETKGAK